MSTKEQFIKLLNKALEWEFAAAIQYVQHAAVITGPEYDAISAELIIHSNEEMIHAVSVSNIIADLGAIPSIDVEKRDCFLNNIFDIPPFRILHHNIFC